MPQSSKRVASPPVTPTTSVRSDNPNGKPVLLAGEAEGAKKAVSFMWDVISVVVLTLFSLWSRLHDIASPNFVSWDEAHFGKFAGWYVKREFYFDVHPPLGKMMLGLIAYLTGFDGKFDFESTHTYPEDTPYAQMRTICAAIAALTVPILFMTARQMGMSRQASILSAVMILCDMSSIALGRLILIDAVLFLGTLLSMMSLAGFRNQYKQPFTRDWWLWLVALGVSIGVTSSIKWIGLFVVAVVGLHTIGDLWLLMGDKSVSPAIFIKHFIARAVCLIAVPLTLYVLVFVAHFSVLVNSGPGDAYMPSLFQANLNQTKLGKGPELMAYGSVVTMRNNAFDGALLHSHVQTYPAGSRQQQVTSYPHHDNNNYWYVLPAHERTSKPEEGPVRYVQNGDVIILRHNNTKANLHSHAVPAPMTTSDYEVSCYGNEQMGDENDFWRVELFDDLTTKTPDNLIHALTTRFRLRHIRTNCLLWSHAKTLPEWGFKQHETTCHRTDINETNVFWNMEENINARLPPNTRSIPKFPFFSAFLHLNAAMWHGNNALTPDPTKVDELTSPPSYWPLLTKGIRMTSWAEAGPRMYMLGNPAVWWGGLFALVMWIVVVFLHDILIRRNNHSFAGLLFSTEEEWNNFYVNGRLLFLGWLFHYTPFFIMARVTYLHHYVPAVLFLALFSGLMADYATAVIRYLKPSVVPSTWSYTLNAHRPIISHVAVIYLPIVVAVFATFYQISYGMRGPYADFANLQWVSTWHLI